MEPFAEVTLSKPLREYLEQRLAEAKARNPDSFSPDGKSVMLFGSLGFECYFSPGGDVFLEEYDLADGTESRSNRSKRGRISALTISVRYHPLLAELLPHQDGDAVHCTACAGKGFTDLLGTLTLFYLCPTCCGLGWTSPTVFDDSMD